ncbi:unnamed protein product [Caenorhabditis auriculariae]|uniref:Secreted protein n=1 Tax=Caenorhabditis auriculariae TaxID=2777116 RepID=A0A8S1H0D7_9PELO|nr:unnamed protein product [Caenorhabditis auriculariae]
MPVVHRATLLRSALLAGAFVSHAGRPVPALPGLFGPGWPFLLEAILRPGRAELGKCPGAENGATSVPGSDWTVWRQKKA